MKWVTFRIEKEPGFRFNLFDLGILLSLLIISCIIYAITAKFYIFLLPLYIGVTFFLFCNVFRIGNQLEPFWYISFTITVIYGFYHVESFWTIVLLVGEPLKLFLILYRIIKGPYRGIFYEQINMRLNQKK